MLDTLLAVRQIRNKELPHAEGVLHGPVLRLGVPLVVLAHQRHSLQRNQVLLIRKVYSRVQYGPSI